MKKLRKIFNEDLTLLVGVIQTYVTQNWDSILNTEIQTKPGKEPVDYRQIYPLIELLRRKVHSWQRTISQKTQEAACRQLVVEIGAMTSFCLGREHGREDMYGWFGEPFAQWCHKVLGTKKFNSELQARLGREPVAEDFVLAAVEGLVLRYIWLIDDITQYIDATNDTDDLSKGFPPIEEYESALQEQFVGQFAQFFAGVRFEAKAVYPDERAIVSDVQYELLVKGVEQEPATANRNNEMEMFSFPALNRYANFNVPFGLFYWASPIPYIALRASDGVSSKEIEALETLGRGDAEGYAKLFSAYDQAPTKPYLPMFSEASTFDWAGKTVPYMHPHLERFLSGPKLNLSDKATVMHLLMALVGVGFSMGLYQAHSQKEWREAMTVLLGQYSFVLDAFMGRSDYFELGAQTPELLAQNLAFELNGRLPWSSQRFTTEQWIAVGLAAMARDILESLLGAAHAVPDFLDPSQDVSSAPQVLKINGEDIDRWASIFTGLSLEGTKLH